MLNVVIIITGLLAGVEGLNLSPRCETVSDCNSPTECHCAANVCLCGDANPQFVTRNIEVDSKDFYNN